MEEIMSFKATKEWSTRPSMLSMRDDSHGILKPKPKVRIVHIFAPEIIKTDVANFRELVQRLTGKPAKRTGGKKTAESPMAVAPESSSWCKVSHRESWCGDQRIKGEVGREEEGEMWMDDKFLGGLGDDDGFFQGLGDFSLLPLTSSHFDHVVGETV